MASATDHFEQAEDLLQSLTEMDYTPEQEDRIVRRAKVHAMLAAAAGTGRHHGNPDFHEWARVSNTKREFTFGRDDA